MPKVELFNKQNSIQMALDVFWDKGYKGTSLNDLTDVMSIGKGSFYNTFRSKRALFDQCIHVFKENSVNNLRELLLAEKDVKTGLENYLHTTLDDAVNDQKHRGCFMTNVSTELGASDEEIAQIMNKYYAEMKLIITEYLGQSSELSDNSINETADTFITFFIGMTVQVKLKNNTKQIERSINHLMQSLF